MSLTKVSYSMIAGAKANVLDFGAIADGVTDCTANVQAAMNSFPASGGKVYIPKNVVYTPASLTWINFVDLIDDSFVDGIRVTLNDGTAGGAVNEFVLDSGFHPAYILDVYNNRILDTLVPPQVYSNRASFGYRVNGSGTWQLANDVQGNGTNDWSVYRVGPSSFQALTFTVDSKAIYGQTTAGNNFSADYAHNFRGATFAFENSVGNITIILRHTDDTVRRAITLFASDNSLSISNLANTELVFNLTDAGQLLIKRGISGGAFTTTARNAINVVTEMVGLMVYDTTLGKPVWLANATGPVWHDATGGVV